MKMPFGKHRGQPLADLPADYLRWLTSLPDLRQPLRSAVLDEIERRQVEEEIPRARLVARCPDPEMASELIGAGLRSLARVYHPDAGGSHQRMVLVNAVAGWLRDRVKVA